MSFSKPQTRTDLPTQSFATAEAFTAFLHANHSTSPGLYLKLAKKNSGIRSINAAEAVECALCYGWIDGRANSVDETWWTIRFTPRRKKSVWSKKNVDTVARLLEEGRMQEAGLEKVNEAKEDGRWERAYAGPAGMTVPEDFEEILRGEGNVEAREFWEGLSKSERYPILHRIQTASEKGREGVMQRLVEALSARRVTGMGAVKSKENNAANGKTVAKRKATTKVTKTGVDKKATKNLVVKPKIASSIPGKTASAGVTPVSRRPGLRARP